MTPQQADYLRMLIVQCRDENKLQAIMNANLDTQATGKVINFYRSYYSYLHSPVQSDSKARAEELDRQQAELFNQLGIEI